MDDGYVLVRKSAVMSLLAASTDAVLVLRDRGADHQELAVADALAGARAQVATDLSEPSPVPV